MQESIIDTAITLYVNDHLVKAYQYRLLFLLVVICLL